LGDDHGLRLEAFAPLLEPEVAVVVGPSKEAFDTSGSSAPCQF
jgi:hypothetical protein